MSLENSVIVEFVITINTRLGLLNFILRAILFVKYRGSLIYQKTKVRDLVLRAGIPLRSMLDEKGELVLGSRGKRNMKPPYGYWFLNSEVQRHPKEYPIVLEIIERWKSGKSMNSVATWLNRRGIRSPMNKKLSWNSVNNIISRQEAHGQPL